MHDLCHFHLKCCCVLFFCEAFRARAGCPWAGVGARLWLHLFSHLQPKFLIEDAAICLWLSVGKSIRKGFFGSAWLLSYNKIF